MSTRKALEAVYSGGHGHGGTLPFSSSIYVPSTHGDSRLSPEVHERVAHRIGEHLTDLFGGATVTQGVGMWKPSSTSKPVIEPIHIVSSSYNVSPDQLQRVYSLFNTIAYGLGRALKQHSVTVTHHGDHGHSMHFIETHSGAEHKPKAGKHHFAIGNDESLRRLSERVHDTISGLLGG